MMEFHRVQEYHTRAYHSLVFHILVFHRMAFRKKAYHSLVFHRKAYHRMEFRKFLGWDMCIQECNMTGLDMSNFQVLGTNSYLGLDKNSPLVCNKCQKVLGTNNQCPELGRNRLEYSRMALCKGLACNR